MLRDGLWHGGTWWISWFQTISEHAQEAICKRYMHIIFQWLVPSTHFRGGLQILQDPPRCGWQTPEFPMDFPYEILVIWVFWCQGDFSQVYTLEDQTSLAGKFYIIFRCGTYSRDGYDKRVLYVLLICFIFLYRHVLLFYSDSTGDKIYVYI